VLLIEALGSRYFLENNCKSSEMQFKDVGMSQKHTKLKQIGILVVRTEVKIFKLSFTPAMPYWKSVLYVV